MKLLHFFATAEKVVPIAAQGGLQTRQRWQGWKVFSSLDALKITRAHSGFFGQFLLGQFSASPQTGDVLSEPCSMRTRFGFARRHRQILTKRCAAKHEALHRATFFLMSKQPQRQKAAITGKL